MSRMSKACEIPPRVRKKVLERDGGRCIICGSSAAAPNSHYIKRSHGGLGIEQNAATMCIECHNEYDNGSGDRQEDIKRRFREHLESLYLDWNEEDLYYDKYKWVKEHEAD